MSFSLVAEEVDGSFQDGWSALKSPDITVATLVVMPNNSSFSRSQSAQGGLKILKMWRSVFNKVSLTPIHSMFLPQSGGGVILQCMEDLTKIKIPLN